MASENLLKVFILLNSFAVFSCSIIEINETTYATLPPLYALDEWSQCQRPGDVYCIVDAHLKSNQPSTLLQLLQDYSKQKLKHFNRTLIHRGVCVTRCLTENDESNSWNMAAQHCVNDSVQKYGLEAEVLSVDWCYSVDSPPVHSTTRALGIMCIVLVVFVFLATGVHMVGDKCNVDGNKYLLAFSLKSNWDILMYDRSRPRSDERMRDIACMEGIRFLGVLGVIFTHVLFTYIYSFIDNPQFVEHMYDSFGWQAAFNSPLWLQSFFSLSGFLTAYYVLIYCENKNLTFFRCLIAIMNRWIRLTPAAAFALWFTIAWFPLLGSGPQWNWLVQHEAVDCAERWWYHVIYVHNYLPLGKYCMGHTWFLAADMQLHVVGVMILLIMVRYRKTVAPILGTLLVITILACGITAYIYQVRPIVTMQTPEEIRTMFPDSVELPKLYLPTWTNLSGYVCGIATAFILHYNQTNGVKLNKQKWFNIVFHLALPIAGIVVLSGAVFLFDTPPPQWVAVLYSAFDRTLVAVCFNVFMLGCFSRCKSIFRTLLNWRGFYILGRLSYCAYIVHFIVLRMTLANNTQLGHASIFSMISLLVTGAVLTYIASIPLCLLIELPAVQLWKALTTEERERPREQDNTTQGATMKPFDLVAHVSKRQQV